MEHKTDLRVLKTKKNIKDSFIVLLETYDFHEITVQNILDTALINRSTFYKYYHDKYDLAQQLAADYMEISNSYLTKRFADIIDDDLIYVVKNIYSHMLRQKRFIQALWRIETTTIHPFRDFESLLKSRCNSFLLAKHGYQKEKADYRSSLYASIIITTISWLFQHENTSIDAVIKQLTPVLTDLVS